MSIRASLRHAEGLRITPMEEVPAALRTRLRGEAGQHLLWLPGARTPAKLLDRSSAMLMEEFTQPTRVVEAVARFARARALDPEGVLIDAFPLLRELVAEEFLVPADAEPAPSFGLTIGHELGGFRLIRPIRRLTDSEVYFARRETGGEVVLKIVRDADGASSALLDREAHVLGACPVELTPRLVHSGREPPHRFLAIEWCPGVSPRVFAEELRSGPEARFGLVDLLVRLSSAYAELHDAGIVHGDVHEANLIVERDGAVRLIDFGWARIVDPEPAEWDGARPALSFLSDPELGRALLDGSLPPPPTVASEQYSVAALLYSLVAGHHYVDFSLERSELARQICETSPFPLTLSGKPWPELDRVLRRALSKDPGGRYSTMSALRDALERVRPPRLRAAAPRGGTPADPVGRFIDAVSPGGGGWRGAAAFRPRAGVALGTGGVALSLAEIAVLRDDAEILALADLWARRASEDVDAQDAFYRHDWGLTPALFGPASALYGRFGVDVTRAITSAVGSDPEAGFRAVHRMTESGAVKSPSCDLALGTAGTLMACLHYLHRTKTEAGHAEVERLARGLADGLSSEVMTDEPFSEAVGGRLNLGAAHGWAGVLHALLRWSEWTEHTPASRLVSRLHELADTGRPFGRGVRWPWLPDSKALHGESTGYMGGWCNGGAGFTELWTAAHRVTGEARFSELVVASAWNAWESESPSHSLCCGSAGRALALLAAYRHTGDPSWVDRASKLVHRALPESFTNGTLGLYRGHAGIVLSFAALERPEVRLVPPLMA